MSLDKGAHVKRRDMGIAGILVVLSQILSSAQSQFSTSSEFKELRASFERLRNEQDQFFVRREEFKQVVSKLDKMSVDITEINDQIKIMRDNASASLDLEDGEDYCQNPIVWANADGR